MTTVETRPRMSTYRTTTEWMGLRNGRVTISGKEPVVISTPPDFWSPQDLFVASVESCFMLTFLALAEKHNVPVEAYYSEATGEVACANGEDRFTRIVVKPTVIISTVEWAPKTLQLIASAQMDCLIANSIQAEVKIEPDVLLSASE